MPGLIIPKESGYDGIYCNLLIKESSNGVVLLGISGTDVGEFGNAPMTALNDWVTGSGPIELFIDARDVRGASIEVSGAWAGMVECAYRGIKESRC